MIENDHSFIKAFRGKPVAQNHEDKELSAARSELFSKGTAFNNSNSGMRAVSPDSRPARFSPDELP
ncbi:hypothetical protein ACQZ6B_02845 [Agrobacterium vitis]